MVNNPYNIYIEKYGKIYPTVKTFLDEAHLLRVIDKIVSKIGRRVDEASPYVDARLPECKQAFDSIDKNVDLIRDDVSKTFKKIDKLDDYLRGNGRKK